MSALTVDHRSAAALRAAAPRPDAAALSEAALTVPPDAPAHVRLVGPGAVPEGAVVLGHLVAVPAGHGRLLVAVPGDPDLPTAHATPVPDTVPGPEGVLVQGAPGLVIDRWGRRVVDDDREVALTRREFELLEHLACHPGRVFTRHQLLSAVWEMTDARYAPPRTVDVHVSRLRRKLGRHAGALQSLRGVGYRWSAGGGS